MNRTPAKSSQQIDSLTSSEDETLTRYVIITPVRDEEQYIASTIASVCSQTVRPAEWIIVNDGSTDRTGEILDRFAREHSWIRPVHRENRGFRKPGGGVMEAFYEGYKAIQTLDWEFLVKLDADLTFDADYFENCFQHFDRDPKLGIGGGEIRHEIDGEMKAEKNPTFHVRGATKIYRRACWEAIDGLWTASGWDTIDEVKANMKCWNTYTFTELGLFHHRFTGSEEGLLRDRVKHGVACYVAGYHPLFVAASCVHRLAQKPRVTGSLAILYGFLKAHVTRPPRLRDRSYVAYIRGQQLRRLCGMETIWR
jgi:poly-beta-1,6-N-acetyl-D-glucosamine synthase